MLLWEKVIRESLVHTIVNKISGLSKLHLAQLLNNRFRFAKCFGVVFLSMYCFEHRRHLANFSACIIGRM